MTTKKDIQMKGGKAEVYFDHQGHEITFQFSLYSGKEKVFVDGELVSESRNWSFSSTHTFKVDGTHYDLTIAITKSLKGFLLGHSLITLKANGAEVDSDEFNYSKTSKGEPFNWKKFFLGLLPYFIIGAVVGFCVSYFSINFFS